MNYNKQQALFFDIETTGLSADVSAITLIGCCDMDGNVIQWFNDDGFSQKQILCDFLDFIKSYNALISFNGKTFDLPFLTSKIKEFKLDTSLDPFLHLDLYQILKPYKKLWGLQRFRQKDLETYLGICRNNDLSGKKLIKTYQNYLESKNTKDKNAILSHNKKDLLGLYKIYSLMSYPALLDKNFSINSTTIQHKQLIVNLKLSMDVPVTCEYEKDRFHLILDHLSATLSCPITDGCLKHHHRDYKNYYYLPKEDIVIHKSMKSFVDTTSLVRASMDNCYSKFVPSETFLSDNTDLLNFCSDTIYFIFCSK